MQRNQNRTKYLKLLGGALFVALLPANGVTAFAADVPVANAPVANVQAQEAETTLSVVARNGVKSENAGLGQLDLGDVDSLSRPKVDVDFVLRNDRKVPITVGRLQPTCGCTSVILGEGTDATKTLAPGEEVKVRVAVDVARFHGPIRKAVRAYAADGATLLATLEILANIKDPVTLSARQIDLGRVNYGTPISAPLTVTMSPRLLAGGNEPKLVSTDANIMVAPAKDKPAPGASPLERRYLVTVSPKAPIGLITSTLSFAMPDKPATVAATPAESPEKNEEARIATVLQSTQIAVNAEVIGNIRATPTLIVFGKEAVQRVVVTANTSASLKDLKVTSPSPWIKARLVPVAKPVAKPAAKLGNTKPAAGRVGLPAPTNAPATAIFELSLDPKAPVGALETQVIVTTATGERLNLPVLADIVAPPA